MLENYWSEFMVVAVAHFFAVISPGPDFAIVLRHSIAYGKKAALLTSVGIAIGLLIHICYSLLGIGILIKTIPWLFNILIYVAAAYLGYLGWQALQSRPNLTQSEEQATRSMSITGSKAFWVGFLTNGLNPKATLFFLSLFALAVSTDTPTQVKAIYGIYMVVATALWFCFLSLILSGKKVRQFFNRNGFWFDRIMGIILIGLALRIVFETWL
jgi:RhtB (resistance to homoserine/threonine) family protein